MVKIISGPAAAATASGATYLYKDADETVNNSTTLQDDDDLTFTMTADKLYAFEMALLMTGNSSADFKLNIDVASSGTADYLLTYANPGLSFTGEIKWEGQSTSVGVDGSWHQSVSAKASGIMVCDGTNRLVKLQWAQASANASDTKLLKGSWLAYKELS